MSPADAAVGSEAHSDSVFLDSTLLNGTLAGIGGAHADYVDGTTTGPGVVDNSGLDVNALNALGLNLPGVTVTAGQLLNLGVITQHAEAHPNGVSSSTTGTAALTLDLMQLLAPSPALSTANLDLGAVQSSASVDAANPGSLTRTTTVASANLNLQSPVVADITTTTNEAVNTLDTTLAGLQGPINTAVNGALGTIATLLSPLSTTGTPTTTVTIDSTRLDQAVQNVLNQPLSTSLVTLDPSTGKITVNLAGGIDLNNIPPNSTLLSPAVLQQVSADVASLLNQLQTELNQIVTNAPTLVDVTIASSVPVTVPLVGTNTLSVNYSGSLQDLVSGATPVSVTAGGVLAPLLTPVLGAAQTAVQTAVAGVVNPVVTTAVAAAGNTIDTAVTQATNALAPALTALGGVAEVNLNVQNASDGITSQADVTAVQVRVLGGTVTELNLATSSVGPNSFAAITPAIDATNNPVPAGTDAPVSGSGWINNSNVTLQLVDAAGNPVGNPVTVATDGTGAFPAGTSIPVPAGTAPGTYTVRATDAAGNTATDTITVPDTTPPPVTITGPADGSSTNDTTPTITGTTEPGATVHVVVRDDTGTIVFQGDATVAPNGNWTIDSTALPEGTYTVAATATDPAGNTATANSTFTVDTTPPPVAITSPADGSSTNDTTPTVTGTTEPGATVHVVVRDDTGAIVFQGDAPVDANGNWAIDSSVLPDGPYTATATATDPAGNTATDTTAFTVDSAAPVVDVVNPADGTTTNNPSPTVTGTVNEPAATVNVVVTDSSGAAVFNGPATVDATGNWTVDLAAAGVVLANGTYTATATATDPAGNTATDANTFTVDLTAPAIAITTPANGSSTSDTTPTIAGTTEAGATVHVVVRDSTGAIVFQGDPPVGPTGTWTIDSSVLPEGTYSVTATATDPAGNTATDAVSFTVDTTAPVVAITGPADGSRSNDTTPTITGTVDEPASTVHVVVTDSTGTIVFQGDATVAPDGTWTIDSTALPEGSFTVTATATDPAGNTGTATSGFVVDTTPPAVDVTGPADGSTTNDNTPAVTGTTEPGATVHVVITDSTGATVFQGDATVAPDGSWTVTPGQPLPDGAYTVTATATDGAGNTATDSNTFTVDATVPAAPVITSPADGSTTNDSTPTVTGTGEPGATVTVTIDGQPAGTATVAPDGTWTLPVTTPLADGPHTVTATQTDGAGNTSPTATNTFTVDTTAPAAPVITGPADGSSTNDTTPTITGTGEPGATVTVTIDGQPAGTATVAPDGTWTLPVTTPLAEGPHTVTAAQTDAAGNTSPTATSTFTVDLTAPGVTITGPADGSTTADSTPTITGTTEAGATVHVVVRDDTGTIVFQGDAAVDANGSWTIDSSTLPDGPYTVTATATDAAGNSTTASNAFTVDTTAPAVAIVSPADGTTTNNPTPTVTGTGEAGATVTVVVDGTPVGTTTVDQNGSWSVDVTTPLAPGQHTVEATATDAVGNSSTASSTFTVDLTAPAIAITSPTPGELTNDNTPTITGTTEPGATVHVVITRPNGSIAVEGDATVAPDGSWRLPVTTALGNNTFTVTATATDAGGNEASDAVSFTVDAQAPAAPVITSPPDGSSTNDTTPTIVGTGEPGATVTVVIDGQTVGTATVGNDGTWTVDVTTPLPEGNHTVTATQTDGAGNTSPAASNDFTVDTTAPPAPVITSPTPGSATGDTTPTITGTGLPGATVTVTIDGQPVGSATVGPDGTWSVTVPTPLPAGDHTVSATQTDAAGNTSPAATDVSFTVTTGQSTGSPGGAAGGGSGCPTTARALRPACQPSGQGGGQGGASQGAAQGAGGLADTGAAAGLGLLALLGGAAVAGGLLLVRRRREDRA